MSDSIGTDVGRFVEHAILHALYRLRLCRLFSRYSLQKSTDGFGKRNFQYLIRLMRFRRYGIILSLLYTPSSINLQKRHARRTNIKT